MQKNGWAWLGLGMVVCGLAGFGYWLHATQLEHARAPIHERLASIARLKVDQVSAWRQERLGDAELLRVNSPLTHAARRWLEGTATPGERAETVAYLDQMCQQYRYSGFLLLDAQGAIRHSSLELAVRTLDDEGRAALGEALRSRRAVLSDLHGGKDFPYPHLSAIVPIVRGGDPAGAILLLIDARASLFPLIQSWPGLSASGEVLLVRRDGDQLLFLNDPRYQPDAALKLRLPLSQPELPAARLVLGERGVIEGRDYRGVPVLVAGLPIPGTPWFLVAKVDAEEILAPARREAMIPVGAMIIAVLLLGGLGRLVWSRRQRQHAASLRRLDSERLVSLRKFENLFEQSLDGILLLTADHRFLDANPAALRMLGYGRDELLRLRLPAILAQAEQARLAVEVPVMMAGTPHHQEWRHVRKDGTTFIGAVTAKALDDERYFATLRDITEQKQREAQEQARTRVLDLMTKNASLPALLETLVTTVEASHPGILCSILQLDETGQRLIHGAAPSLPDFYNQAMDGVEIGPEIGSCGAAACTGQRVIVGDIQTHPNWGPFREVAARAGLGACWSEPIKSSAGKVMGTFAIYHHEPEEPGPAELQLIEQSANLAAIALERSRVSQALALSEQRYALANRATSNIIWDWDLETRRVWWNDNFYTLLGGSRETAPPCHEEWMRRLHPEDRPNLLAEFEAALAGDATEWTGAYRLRRQAGDYVELEDHCHIQRDAQGHALRLVGAMQDVTQRNAAESRAHQAADRYRRMLQASKDGFWLVDAATGRLLDVNQAACDLTGHTRDELLDKTILDIDVVHSEAMAQERIQHVLKTGGGFFETRYRTQSGRILDIEVSVIADAEARLIHSFHRDITERNRMLEALRASEQRLGRESERNRYLLQAATDGIHVVDERGYIMLANRAFADSLGYPEDATLGLHITDFDTVFSAGQVDRNLPEWLGREQPITFETRHRRHNGEIFDVEVTARAVTLDGRRVLFASSRDITERKQAEEILRTHNEQLEQRVAERTAALTQSEERLRKIAERVPGVIFQFKLRPDGSSCFPYASAGIQDIYGVTPEQVREDAAPVFAVIHPEDQEDFVATIMESARTQRTRQHEFRVRFGDGTVRWRSGNATPEQQPDGSVLWHGYVQDITDLKLAEQDKIDREAYFRNLADAVPVMIWLMDADRGCTFFNRTALEFRGRTLDQECGTGWIEGFHPEDVNRSLTTFTQAFQIRQAFSLDLRLRRHDGEWRWIQDMGVPQFDRNGEFQGYIGACIDITERKQAEQEIHELNASLERKVEERTAELVAASAAKSQFLAHMSHEIRTPMNAVLGLTQLLAQEPLAPGQAAMVRHIGEAGDSLLRIINDILDLSKIEAGQIQLENQPFALTRLLHHIDSLLRPSAIRKGLTLSVAAPSGQPDRFLGDQTRLEQVLINLVGNAIKFTSAGSVELAATLLAEDGQRARFRFSVRDTGIGLSPEARIRLFQPFSQGDASITRRFGGTGLGLSISKRLVELMGGEMGLASEEGRGSDFWFELDLARAGDTEEDDPATGPAMPTPEGSALPGFRILAVDDNRINLMVLEKALKKEGALVTLAADGQQALQILRTQAQAFDLVLMDVQMPVMDGLTATREIRRNPDLRTLPVIALTAGVLPEERQAALNAGMNGFLAKPLNLQHMRGMLAQFKPKSG